jgi:hypothetical protein
MSSSYSSSAYSAAQRSQDSYSRAQEEARRSQELNRQASYNISQSNYHSTRAQGFQRTIDSESNKLQMRHGFLNQYDKTRQINDAVERNNAALAQSHAKMTLNSASFQMKIAQNNSYFSGNTSAVRFAQSNLLSAQNRMDRVMVDTQRMDIRQLRGADEADRYRDLSTREMRHRIAMAEIDKKGALNSAQHHASMADMLGKSAKFHADAADSHLRNAQRDGETARNFSKMAEQAHKREQDAPRPAQEVSRTGGSTPTSRTGLVAGDKNATKGGGPTAVPLTRMEAVSRLNTISAEASRTSNAAGNTGFRGFFNNLIGIGNRASQSEAASVDRLRDAGMKIMLAPTFNPAEANRFLKTYNASVSEYSSRTYRTSANFSQDAANFSGSVQRTVPTLVNLGVSTVTGNTRLGALAGASTSGTFSGINQFVGNRLGVSNADINRSGGSVGRRGVGDMVMQGVTAINTPTRFLSHAKPMAELTTRQLVTNAVKVTGFETVRDTVASVATRRMAGDLPKGYNVRSFVNDLAGNAVQNGVFEGGGAALKKLNNVVVKRTGVDLPGHAEAARKTTGTRVSLNGGAAFKGVGLANLVEAVGQKLPKAVTEGIGAPVFRALDPLRNATTTYKAKVEMEWDGDGKLVKLKPATPDPKAAAGTPDPAATTPRRGLDLRPIGDQARATWTGTRQFAVQNLKDVVGSVIPQLNPRLDKLAGSGNKWIDEALKFENFKLPGRLGVSFAPGVSDTAFKQVNSNVNDLINSVADKHAPVFKDMIASLLPSLNQAEGITFDLGKQLKNGQLARTADGSLTIPNVKIEGDRVILTKALDIGHKSAIDGRVKAGELVGSKGTSLSYATGTDRKFKLPEGTAIPKPVYDQMISAMNSMGNLVRKVSAGKGVGQVEIAIPISTNIVTVKGRSVGPDIDNLTPEGISLNPSYVSLPTTMRNFMDVAPGLKPAEDIRTNKPGVRVTMKLPFTLEATLELAAELRTNMDKRADLLEKLKAKGVPHGRGERMIDNLETALKLAVRDQHELHRRQAGR